MPLPKFATTGTLGLCLSVIVSLAGAQAAHASSDSSHALPNDVPPGLEVPPHEQLLVKALGVGVQIYTCGPSQDDPQRYGWSLTAPEATLFEADGHRIGKHYGGPSWEANDGSKIVGTVKAHFDRPSGAAIAWLLVVTKSSDKSGMFARVKTVQRLHTVAGVAPSMPCDAASAGRIARVPYSADYYFYEPAR